MCESPEFTQQLCLTIYGNDVQLGGGKPSGYQLVRDDRVGRSHGTQLQLGVAQHSFSVIMYWQKWHAATHSLTAVRKLKQAEARAVLADEQLKSLTAYINTATVAYQKEITRLRQAIAELKSNTLL